MEPSGGLRAEQTNSEGILTRADGQVQADNEVKRHYLDVFPVQRYPGIYLKSTR